MVRYLPLQPISWPQDSLQVADGHGDMPRVNPENEFLTQKEPFVYGGSIICPAGVPVTTIIQIQADADFWCDEIIMTEALGGGVNYGLAAQMTVEDIRTGYNLCYPYVRACVFNCTSTLALNGFLPTTARLMATMIQPYCFTRNGGIKITGTNPVGAATVTILLTFAGWKEYKHASH